MTGFGAAADLADLRERIADLKALVDSAHALLEPLAEYDPAVRAWLASWRARGSEYYAVGAEHRENEVTLSASAREVLRQLFLGGPVYDGNVASKTGRDELEACGYVERGRGYQWVTRAGVAQCLALRFDGERARLLHVERMRHKFSDD